MKDILYNILMAATKFVIGMDIIEGEFNIEQTKVGRAMIVLSDVIGKILYWCFWLGFQFMLISLTGGLYLIWIVFKLRRKAKKNRNQQKQD